MTAFKLSPSRPEQVCGMPGSGGRIKNLSSSTAFCFPRSKSTSRGPVPMRRSRMRRLKSTTSTSDTRRSGERRRRNSLRPDSSPHPCANLKPNRLRCRQRWYAPIVPSATRAWWCTALSPDRQSLNIGPCDARNAAISIRMRSVRASETERNEHRPLFDAAGQAVIRYGFSLYVHGHRLGSTAGRDMSSFSRRA
jgi:hypothetical protein